MGSLECAWRGRRRDLVCYVIEERDGRERCALMMMRHYFIRAETMPCTNLIFEMMISFNVMCSLIL